MPRHGAVPTTARVRCSERIRRGTAAARRGSGWRRRPNRRTGIRRRVAAGAVVIGIRGRLVLKTPPVRLIDSATLLRQVAAVIASMTDCCVVVTVRPSAHRGYSRHAPTARCRRPIRRHLDDGQSALPSTPLRSRHRTSAGRACALRPSGIQDARSSSRPAPSPTGWRTRCASVIVALDRAEHGRGNGRIGENSRWRQRISRDLIEGHLAVRRVDAARRHEDGLRRRASGLNRARA